MAFTDNFKQFISKQVDDAVELIFMNAHGYALSTSGDITPEQELKLDSIKEDLKRLVETQVTQNLTEEQLKSYGIPSVFDEEAPAFEWDAPEDGEPKIWMVPVCRTGFGSRTIEVIARTEQEAIHLAIDAAGGESFSENDAEYSAPDGAHKKL